MDLTTEYMTSYEEKIKMANKNGLFCICEYMEKADAIWNRQEGV